MKKYLITIIAATTILFSSCSTDETVSNNQEKSAEEEANDSAEHETVDYTTTVSKIGDFSNYDFRSLLKEEDVFSIVDANGNIGYISTDGEILIEPKYVGAMNYSDGLVFVVDQEDNRYYIDMEENIVIDNVEGLKFGIGDNFENGYAAVALYDSDNEVVQRNNYVIDKSGEIILRPTDQDQYFWKVDDNAYAFGPDYLSFNCEKVLDLEGNELDLSNYENYNQDTIFYLEEADFYYTVDESTGLYAVYDFEKGEAVTDFIYSKFSSDYGKNVLAITPENKYIFLDNTGEIFLDVSAIYPTGIVSDVIDDEKIVVNFNDGNTVKLIDFDGNVIKDTDFTHISYFIDGIAIVIKDDKYGYCNENLTELLDATYDSVTFAYNGSGLVIKDGILYKFELEK